MTTIISNPIYRPKLAENDGTDIGNVDVASIASGDNNIGNVDVVTMPTTDVQGDTAHDASDSGDPVKVGGKAESTLPSAVADGDRVNGWFDLFGRQVVMPIVANATKGSTVSMGAGDGTKSDEIDLPARVVILTKVILDFSNHYRANTISIERENSSGTLQQYIIDTTDKINDTGYIEIPCYVPCTASDKIEINVTNTASKASELDWRIEYFDPSPPSS